MPIKSKNYHLKNIYIKEIIYNVDKSSRFDTFSNDTLSLKAFNVVTPYEIKPPTQIGSTSANPRNVKAASMRT